MNKNTKEKIVLGKYEWVFFEDVDHLPVKAKIDSGARTSSIHSGFSTEEIVNGKKILKCTLLGDRKKIYTFDDYTIKSVKSSNGLIQKRFTIKLNVLLANHHYKAEFTLSKRTKMAFPVLIGRNLLRKGFLIDVSKKFTFLPEDLQKQAIHI